MPDLPSEIWTQVAHALIHPFNGAFETVFWSKESLVDLRERQRSLVKLSAVSRLLFEACQPAMGRAFIALEREQLAKIVALDATESQTPNQMRTLIMARATDNLDCVAGHLYFDRDVAFRHAFYTNFLPKLTCLTSLSLSTVYQVYPDALAPLLGLGGQLRLQLKTLRFEGILANDSWLDFISAIPAIVDISIIAKLVRPYAYNADACDLISTRDESMWWHGSDSRLPNEVQDKWRLLSDWDLCRQYVFFHESVSNLRVVKALPTYAPPLALTRLDINTTELRGCSSLDVFLTPAFRNLEVLRLNAGMRRSGHSNSVPFLFSPSVGISDEMLSIKLVRRSISRLPPQYVPLSCINLSVFVLKSIQRARTARRSHLCSQTISHLA